MDHQIVPGAGREEGMKSDQRFGAEAQKVAWTGVAYRRGMDDGLGNG